MTDLSEAGMGFLIFALKSETVSVPTSSYRTANFSIFGALNNIVTLSSNPIIFVIG